MNLKNYWASDFPASLVVFLVAVPMCLGIALASGAPLLSGLLGGIIGGIVVGSLSGSPLSISAPAAGLTSIVAASILELGSFPAFLLCVVLAGIIQIIMGFLRAGSIGHFFPSSVIKGMLAGIGLILVLKQIPHAVGYDVDFEGDESFFQDDGQNTFSEIIQSWDFLTPGAIIITSLSIGLLVLWDSRLAQRNKFFSIIPAPLGVVLVGVLVGVVFNHSVPSLMIDDKHFVDVPLLNESESLSAFFVFPDFSMWQNSKIYYAAVTIAIVASLETLLNVEACDKIDPFRRITPLNRELKAQGTANLLSGMLGGLPVTSVIVRSSTNISSGAHTKASAISQGVILLVAVLAIPKILQMIPLACLAGILIVIGFQLTHPSLYKSMYSKGWGQFLPFITTVLAVTFTNLLQGVFMGILVAIIFILRSNKTESIILVSNGSNYLLRFTRDISFLNKANLRNKLLSIPENSEVIIDGSQTNFIDADIKETIEDFIKEGSARNIKVDLKKIFI
ncbi:MAG: SulP family inorganic anion transporter [Bacteroidia bacterium]|nr:SulP family inorganic anion transporter [Bacteroidia bacterium]